MKLYDVIYDNDNAEGTALVSAQKAGDIENILRSEGRLNGNIYKVTSIKEVGCSNYPQGVVSEYYGGNAITPEPTPTPPKDFDIDSMSLEDLSKLKTKLNRADRVLYVDKIVELTPYPSRCKVSFHPNADVGYSFMNIGRDESTYQAYHVYVKTKDGYKDLGIPSNYAYVQSAQYRVKISNYQDVRGPILCNKEDIRPLRYGIFIRQKCSRGDKKGTYHKLIFINFVGGLETKSIMRWNRGEIRKAILSVISNMEARTCLRKGTIIAMREDQRAANYTEYHGLLVLGRVKFVKTNRGKYLSNRRQYRMVGDPIRYIKARFFIDPIGNIVESYIRIL